jgi:uncharacterized membrane protein
VILADVAPESLGFQGRKALSDFVAGGGGLLVLGGFQALGAGGVQRSFLEDLLPVRVEGIFDLRPHRRPAALKPTGDALFPPDVAWSSKPVCLWQHAAAAKPEAKVIVTAGGLPFLIAGRYGKGRVAVCAGTVLGQPPPGATAFWQWRDWPKVVTAAMDYVAQRRDW